MTLNIFGYIMEILGYIVFFCWKAAWFTLNLNQARKKAERRRMDAFNCGIGIGIDSWESLGLQGDPASPS